MKMNMRTMRNYWLSVAFLGGMSLLTACGGDDNGPTPPPPGGEGVTLQSGATLQGDISANTSLVADGTYKLSGRYTVKAGATLTIPAGVTIEAVDDQTIDYILVEQGGKIIAQGTAENPIVMTAELKQAGAWGGIHICGNAPTNAEGGVGSSEIGGATYGGNITEDNSGILQYVRVEYGGYTITEDTEANGFTFYGVGSGTTVDHCVAYKGSDDGFEWFGGTVNASNLVSINNSDDSFDWTEGWNGTVTNLVAYQAPANELGYDCDCLIEADNNENNFESTPVSHPTLNNLVLVGNGSDSEGVRLRRGTGVNINNGVFCNKGEILKVESPQTQASLTDGGSKITNTTISGTMINEAITAENDPDGKYTGKEWDNADFLASAGNSVDTNLSLSFDDIKAQCTWLTGAWAEVE